MKTTWKVQLDFTAEDAEDAEDEFNSTAESHKGSNSVLPQTSQRMKRPGGITQAQGIIPTSALLCFLPVALCPLRCTCTLDAPTLKSNHHSHAPSRPPYPLRPSASSGVHLQSDARVSLSPLRLLYRYVFELLLRHPLGSFCPLAP